MKRTICLIICTCAVLFLSGCGTIIGTAMYRIGGMQDEGDQRVYHAVVCDWFWLQAPTFSGPWKGGKLEGIAFCVGAIIDFPISVVTDTALLPVDLVLWYWRKRKAKKPQQEHAPDKPET